MSSRAELRAMKVNELKALCTSRGLDNAGLKNDLVARLFESISGTASEPQTDDGVDADADDTTELQEPPVDASTDDVDTIAEPSTNLAQDLDSTQQAAGTQRPKKHTAIVFDEAVAQVAPPAATAAVAATVATEAPAAATVAPSTTNEGDKLKSRAARFGVVKEADKIKGRAERFGLPNADLDKEKKLKRAERFDLPVPEREQAKKQKRAERFGVLSGDEKLNRRAERFASAALKGTSAPKAAAVAADPEEEARRKARAARFAAAS